LIFYQIGHIEIEVLLGILKLARRINATDCATVAFAVVCTLSSGFQTKRLKDKIIVDKIIHPPPFLKINLSLFVIVSKVKITKR